MTSFFEWLPFLVCVVGALIFYFSTNAKLAALGKDAFWVGLFVTLLVVSHNVLGKG